jgi:phage-related protein
VSFAFDSLTEEQLARLKRHFGDKGIHDLIFDESPYKVYSAKVTGTATIKHIPFNEGTGKERVYKGEGTIQFTCYNPFARSRFKWLNEYTNGNKEEWSEASGMKTSNTPPAVYNATSYDAYY